jgi:hypothetical protein
LSRIFEAGLIEFREILRGVQGPVVVDETHLFRAAHHFIDPRIGILPDERRNASPFPLKVRLVPVK